LYVEAMTRLQRVGNSHAISCALALADIRIAQGRLHEARQIYTQALELGPDPGVPILRGTADMHVGLSELHREHNDLDAANEHLQQALALGEHAGLPQHPYRRRVATARLQAARGNMDGAIELLAEAERVYDGDFYPNVRPIAALKARLWLAQGRLGEALSWVRAQGLTVDDEPTYLREFDHLTLARVLLVQHQRDHTKNALLNALRLLERLQPAAEAGGRVGSFIECLMLLALARQSQGDLSAALVSLDRALRLAEPAGYVRLFVDEGLPMARLLREATAREPVPGFAARLLAALEPEPPSSAAGALRPAAAAPPSLLQEPLSQRELEVLRLLSTELSGPEIASELVIALTTLRTHTKRIYSKLNVDSRRAAVKRAGELGLI
jgi:LuxR family maltose regulon positive regulatory protein